MQISLRKLQPVFLEESSLHESEVWTKDLRFNKGEHIHIIAPSGSGKTSLIHFLYGIRKDYHGEIHYDEHNINRFDSEQFSTWRQKHISIVFQDLRLFPAHSVHQNIEVKRLLKPFHAESKILEMAKRLGVAEKLNSRCSTCSYGEQQRVAIIRALQQPFDFLFLDEPFSHLDENNREKAMMLMEEESNARNATIVLADLREIEYFKYERRLHL